MIREAIPRDTAEFPVEIQACNGCGLYRDATARVKGIHLTAQCDCGEQYSFQLDESNGKHILPGKLQRVWA